MHDMTVKEDTYGNQMVLAIILIPRFTNYKTLCFHKFKIMDYYGVIPNFMFVDYKSRLIYKKAMVKLDRTQYT